MKTKLVLLITVILSTGLDLIACGAGGCKSLGTASLAGGGLIGLLGLLCCGLPILLFIVYAIYSNSKNKKQDTDC